MNLIERELKKCNLMIITSEKRFERKAIAVVREVSVIASRECGSEERKNPIREVSEMSGSN